jgi:anaerobic magnesium-protoporphyrin IX monomethyl ester cyclase
MERKFYDLGRVGYWGPQSKKVDFGFDSTRKLDEGQLAALKAQPESRRRKGKAPPENVRAC